MIVAHSCPAAFLTANLLERQKRRGMKGAMRSGYCALRAANFPHTRQIQKVSGLAHTRSAPIVAMIGKTETRDASLGDRLGANKQEAVMLTFETLVPAAAKGPFSGINRTYSPQDVHRLRG